MNSQMAPVESHIGDFFDESAEDSFFLPPGAREMGCQEELSTLFNADDGVALVLHLARECSAHYALLDSVQHYRHMYPRVMQLPMTIRRRQVYFVEASNMDAMLGNTEALRRILRQVLVDPETRVVVLAATCLAEMTGMHLRGILEEETAGKSIPSVFLELTVDENTPLSEMWAGLLQMGRTGRIQPRRLNLVGYAADDSRFARESQQLLSRLGLSVNGWLIPSFKTAAAAGFPQAGCTVVSTAEIAQEEAAALRRDHADMRYIDLEPPYGVEASFAFHRRIARACAPAADTTVIDQYWGGFAERWRLWRQRAERQAAAVIVNTGEEDSLLDPDKLYGIDLVRVLREMGFSVLIVCRGGSEQAERIEAHFLRQLRSDPAVAVMPTGGSGTSVSRLVAELPGRLVFSEFHPDWRILDGGKVCFGPHDLEMGFSGALRTVVRLTRLAEGAFRGSLDDTCEAGEEESA